MSRRRHGPILSTCVLALVFGVFLVPTGAVAADGTGSRLHPARPDRRTSFNDLLRDRGRAGFLNAALVTTGAGAADVLSADVYSESYTYPAGDMDADGAEDMFIERYTYDFDTDEEALELEAASGATGSTLWQGEGDYVFPFRAGDLDADGAADAIVGSWREYTSAVAVDTMEITFEGVDGSDGDVLWTKTYQDVWSYQDASLVDVLVESDWVEPGGIGDIDGDGSADLLVNSYDIARGCEWVDGTCVRATLAKMEALSGADGSVIATFADDPADQWDGGFVVADATGDGKADVLAGRYDEEYRLELALFSGADQGMVWQQDFGDAWIYLNDVDLTGDAIDDLVAETYLDDEGGLVTRYEAVSLADGESVWASDFAGEGYYFPAGDADGDSGSELLIFDGSAWWDKDEIEAMNVALLRGGSGNAVWSGDVPGDAWVAGDVTGDGVEDMRVDASTFDEAADDYVYSTTFFSGADASSLWGLGGLRTSYLWAARGDLDGDGTHDVLLTRDTDKFVYRALAGATGDALWTEDVVLDGWLSDLTVAGGNLWEVVYHVDDDSETITARRGGDGSERWSRPSVQG